MISKKSIQQVIETARVEEVIQDYVNLKRRGVNMIGLCPFHNEKTPSFTVSPSKNIYKCFGCGKGGNPIQFIMDHENLSFPESVRHLAAKYNIKLDERLPTPEEKIAEQEQESIYILNKFAMEYFQDALFNTDMGKSVGLSYFKERSFREETIKSFGLGYAPEKKDSFTLYAFSKGYKLDILIKAGLSSSKGLDFFRNRVMFPIHNLSGKVVAFGGRKLAADAFGPKYINTPETDIYQKSKILYGVYQSKNQISKEDRCYLVEGYTDVISLHQSGITNVVASSGTSLTVEQIRLVKRYTPNITFIFDGDQAGINAAMRGLDLVLEQDLNIDIVSLPENEDPDSFLNKVGTSTFMNFLSEKGADFILFKMEQLLTGIGNNPVKKSKVINQIIQTIAKIYDPIKRTLYIKEAAIKLDLDEKILIRETNKAVVRSIQNKKLQSKDPEKLPTTSTAEDVVQMFSEREDHNQDTIKYLGDSFQEKDLIRLLVNFGHEIYDEESGQTVGQYIQQNSQTIDLIKDETYKLLIQTYFDELAKGSSIGQDFFVHHKDEAIRKMVTDMMSSPYEYSINWEEKLDSPLQFQLAPDDNYNKDIEYAMNRFKLKKIIEQCEINQERLKAAAAANNEEDLMQYLKVQKKLNERRQVLADILNTVVLK